MESVILDSPLSVPVSKSKKFILNLNNYRNTHYQVLNKAKINYKAIMAQQILKLSVMKRVSIVYCLYPKTKALTDISNVLSIHSKFFEDALVEFNKIEDDNYKFIDCIDFKFARVDKNNPRVEILVTET